MAKVNWEIANLPRDELHLSYMTTSPCCYSSERGLNRLLSAQVKVWRQKNCNNFIRSEIIFVGSKTIFKIKLFSSFKLKKIQKTPQKPFTSFSNLLPPASYQQSILWICCCCFLIPHRMTCCHSLSDLFYLP